MNHPLSQFLFCPECGSDRFAIHDEKSKHCTECGFTYYFNIAAATVALIFNARGELLVCRRAKDPAKGMLDLPGGFVDMKETAEEGVKREVQEETGLRVEQVSYLFSLPNRYPYSGFTVHTLDLFFRCTVSPSATLQPMDDVQALFFVPLDQIRPDEFGLASIREGLKKLLSQGLDVK